MILIDRAIKESIIKELTPNKVSLLLGARRVGKTVLIKQIQNEFPGKTLYLNAEENFVSDILKERNSQNYRNLLNGAQLLIVDEAQVIPEIGRILKLIVDEIEGINVIATGSSGFDLLNKTGEPLTGRMRIYNIFPIAQLEFSKQENILETKQKLDERLIFGSYPEICNMNTNDEKREYLQTLVNTYLLKDILLLEGLRSHNKLFDLLKLVAFQLGKEISYQELSRNLVISKTTVEKYLDLLSKVFILYNLKGFSRNLRKEVTNNSKWYFWDNGIRNAVVSNFSPLAIRQDTGELWENYCISERLKFNHYQKNFANSFFWRTYDQQEVDYVEELDTQLFATEIKWKESNAYAPKAWRENYPEAGFQTIHTDNYLDWITFK